MMSYAGVRLGSTEGSDAGLAAWISTAVRPEDLFPLARMHWPGTITGGPILEQTVWPYRTSAIRIGRLVWPYTASRFAYGHFVVGDFQLQRIREEVGDGQTPLEFVMDDSNNHIVTDLWMLPARPLAQPVPLSQGQGDSGAWLLTLVDDRYHWWETALDLAAPATWQAAYDAIGSALGINIDVDPIPGAYLTPPADYAASYRPVPPLLDAIAFSLGQRIVRDFDGTVSAQNYATAAASVAAEASADWRRFTGGALSLGTS